MVKRMAGGIEKITVAKIAETEQIQKNGIAGIKYRKAGMVCIKSSRGITSRYIRCERAAIIPTGIAMITATMVAKTTSVKVCMVEVQRPRFQIRPRPNTAPKAKRQPGAR